MDQSEFEANACNRCQGRGERGTTGFGFVSHWLSGANFGNKSRSISHSKAKPKQTRNYFRHSIENRSIFLWEYEQIKYLRVQASRTA